MNNNIILQHWTGELDKLGQISMKNIQKYASTFGADYQLLRGNVFQPKAAWGKDLCPPLQKLHMLDESFDDYDIVVMMDMDMFTRKGMDENIFDEKHVGIGVHTERTSQLFDKFEKNERHLASRRYPYWGGAIYKLSREVRQTLRAKIPNIKHKNLEILNRYGKDEGYTHRLATLAQIPKEHAYLNEMWACGSYMKDVKNAAIIHVRYKYNDKRERKGYPRRTKMENYQELVNRGLID